LHRRSGQHVKGFGLKSQAKLLTDIEKLQNREGKFLLLHEAAEQAENTLRHLREGPEVIQAEIAGALRRRKEIIREISVVVASEKPRAVIDRFLRLPTLAHTEELGATRCHTRMASGLEVELIIVPPDEYFSELHARTGSSKHIAKLQELSQSKILEHDRDKHLPLRNEEEIYQRLGLQPIPPELREDEGEIEAAISGTLPQPLSLEDIRGMTHCHTIYSDGRDTIEDMALAAQAMGMSYLTITDHSQTAYYARGVDIDRLRAQWEEIARVQERVTIRLLKGTEADILEDGSLDYPDYVLNQLDIIIASIHARHKMDADQMTERLLRALRLPIFKIWGHPLGRLIRSRPPFACRMDEVLDAIAESRCAIEVNGDPHRLDLEPHWIRQASRRGIKFIVSTDAHSLGGLRNLTFGVAMARRGWLPREHILNTLEVEDFMRAVHP